MAKIQDSSALAKLLTRSGMTREAADLVAHQAGLSVDELASGGWDPFLILMVHLHGAALVCSMCNLPPPMVRDTMRELWPLIQAACDAHVKAEGGLGTLAGLVETADGPGHSEIILPPRYNRPN